VAAVRVDLGREQVYLSLRELITLLLLVEAALDQQARLELLAIMVRIVLLLDRRLRKTPLEPVQILSRLMAVAVAVVFLFREVLLLTEP